MTQPIRAARLSPYQQKGMTMETYTDDVFEYTEAFSSESSLADLVAYNANTRQLLIKFVNGTTRVYIDVDEEIYDDLNDGTSVGAYYNKYIKGVLASYELEHPTLTAIDVIEPTKVNWSGVASGDSITLNGDAGLTTFTLNAAQRYSVRWTVEGMPGPFEFETTAHNEAAAIQHLNSQIKALLGAAVPKILAVTHYLD